MFRVPCVPELSLPRKDFLLPCPVGIPRTIGTRIQRCLSRSVPYSFQGPARKDDKERVGSKYSSLAVPKSHLGFPKVCESGQVLFLFVIGVFSKAMACTELFVVLRALYSEDQQAGMWASEIPRYRSVAICSRNAVFLLFGYNYFINVVYTFIV